MKTVIILLVSLAIFAGCQSLTGDWPVEGKVIEQAYDVPRVGRYWIIGSPREVVINEDYIYWFKIEDRESNQVWVQVTGEEWKVYQVGDWWVKSPDARPRYVPVADIERNRGIDPKRIINGPPIERAPRPRPI
jgi:hypothetical protein